jgi:hypothetical protein
MNRARLSFCGWAAMLALGCNGSPSAPVTGIPDCKVPASDSGCSLTLFCELFDGAVVSGLDRDASFPCKPPAVCPETGGAIELTCAGTAVPDPALMCLNLSSSTGGTSFYCCPCMQQ